MRPCVVILLTLLTAGLLGCSGSAPAESPPAAAAQPHRPNIVMVLVDDMRWDEMRVAGHPFIETPHMDRVAREGARFLNAFATTPLCSPSRASFLTGQYAHTNGIIDNTARPSHTLRTFPAELQRAGYRTGFFGKWHMGNDDSPRPGFNHWVAMPGQGEAIDPSLNVDGERVHAKGYTTDLLTDYVERFIERPSDQPFLVYLAHKAIHPNVIQQDDGSLVPIPGQPGGFVAAERHRGRYAGRPMPRRASAFKPPLGKPALLRPVEGLPPLGRETATTDEEIRGRIEMLLGVDDSLGRILATLREERRARRHRRRVHERSRIFLRRAWAQRGAAPGLRRNDSHSAADSLSTAHRRERHAEPDGSQHRPGADAARAGRRSARRRSSGAFADARARA